MMSDGRSRAEWARMSSLLALVANVHLRPRELFEPRDFNPHETTDSRSVIRLPPKEAFQFLKDVFIKP